MIKKDQLYIKKGDESFKMDDNRRKYFRHKFPTNLCGQIRILSVGGSEVNTKPAYVCIHDLGAGGMRFESHLKIPPRNDVVLEATMTVCETPLTLVGSLTRTINLENGYFEYGMQFVLTEDASKYLLKLINQVSLRFHKKVQSTGCSLCSLQTKCQKNLERIEKETRWSQK